MTSERMDPERILAEIKKIGGFSYNADFISGETYAELFDRLGVTPERNMKILDLGAGVVPLGPKHHSTAYTKEIDERGVLLVPVDMNEVRVRTWQLLPGRSSHPGDSYANPIVADAHHLPFKALSIDGAISINLLNGFRENSRESAGKVLEEVYEVLKPGGFMIVSTFGYYRIVKKDGSEEYSDAYLPSNFVTRESIEETAKRIGFSSVEDIPLDDAKIKETIAYWTNKKGSAPEGDRIERIDCVPPLGLLLRK